MSRTWECVVLDKRTNFNKALLHPPWAFCFRKGGRIYLSRITSLLVFVFPVKPVTHSAAFNDAAVKG